MSELYELYKDEKIPDLVNTCYNDWEAWFNQEGYGDKITENVQLFHGYSEDLAKRKADKSLSRSCLFIPLVGPAAYARAAHITQLTFAVDELLIPKAVRGTHPQKAENVKDYLKDALNKNDFKVLFLHTAIAQELYPICFWSVSETEEEEAVAEKEEELYGGLFPGIGTSPDYSKVWGTETKQWRPQIELRTQEEVFYDPWPTNWKDTQYNGLVMGLTKSEIKELYDKVNIEQLEKDGERLQIPLGKRKEEGTQETEKAGKIERFKVKKLRIKFEDENGKLIKKVFTTCGKIKLKEEDWPYEKLDIPDVLIPLIGQPVVNRFEGTCTADLLKYPQHAVNHLINAAIDSFNYGLFSPQIWDSRVTLLNEMKIGPGTNLKVRFSDNSLNVNNCVKQLFDVSPVDEKYLALANMLIERANITANVPQDILLGGMTDPREKATKTQMRAKGASTRIAGINILILVQALSRLSYTLWCMLYEELGLDDTYRIESAGDIGEAGELYFDDIDGHFEFTVPHLSGYGDRERRVEKLKEYYGAYSKDPIFQHPQIRYNLMKEIAKAEDVADFDKIVPPKIVAQIGIKPEEAEKPSPVEEAPLPGSGIEEMIGGF